jgi:type II secretory pathway component HofQ
MRRVLLFAFCGIALFCAQPPAHACEQKPPYRFNVIIRSGEPMFVNAIVNDDHETALMDANATAASDQTVTFTSKRGGVAFTIVVKPALNGDYLATFDAKCGEAVLQHEEKTVPTGSHPVAAGELVTVNVTDADLADVLRTFETLTGKTITVEPSVHGKVTLHVEDTPWYTALTQAVAPLGLLPKMMADGNIVLLRVIE